MIVGCYASKNLIVFLNVNSTLAIVLSFVHVREVAQKVVKTVTRLIVNAAIRKTMMSILNVRKRLLDIENVFPYSVLKI